MRRSRMPVREALRALAAEGIVTLEPRRGASVTAYTDLQVHELVEVRAKGRDLGLELVNPAPVAHVLGEVVEAVHPVIEGPGDQEESQRHHDDRPEGDAVDVEDRPVDVHGREVAVAENRGRDPDEEADDQRASQQETLPQMVQLGTGPKVTRFAAGSLRIEA